MQDRRRFLQAVAGAHTLGAAWAATANSAEAPTAVPATGATAPPAPPTTPALRIALMQASAAGDDLRQNLLHATPMCEAAAAQGADLLVMPEMWSIGYRGFSSFDAETALRWQEKASDVDGPWVSHFKAVARRLGMAIAVTYLQRWRGEPRNAVTLFDRHGKHALTYAKVHTCDFAFEAALTPGDGWPAVDLDTAKGPVRIGAMICFDREFPESARSLMAAGAEVVITPNACLLDDLRINQFQVRAYENAMAVAMTNYAGPMLNGRSVAFDAAGKKLVEAGRDEGVVLADIDLASLRFYRDRTLWGNAWRRPAAYTPLTREVDLQEFRRTDAFGRAFKPSNT